MSNKETGGPAFPVNSDNYASPDSTGMTLRDYFAAKAMQANYQVVQRMGKCVLYSEMAKDAYIVADAMLKAREA